MTQRSIAFANPAHAAAFAAQAPLPSAAAAIAVDAPEERPALKPAAVDEAWRAELAPVLRRGFFGSVAVEVEVVDGAIRCIRGRTEQITRERALPRGKAGGVAPVFGARADPGYSAWPPRQRSAGGRRCRTFGGPPRPVFLVAQRGQSSSQA